MRLSAVKKLVRRLWLPILTAAGMLAITLGFYFSMAAQRRDNIYHNIETESDKARFAVEAGIRERTTALERMASRWTQRGGTDFDEWSADAKNYHHNFKTFQSIQWIDAELKIRWIESFDAAVISPGTNVTEEFALPAEMIQSLRDGKTEMSRNVSLKNGGRGILTFVPVSRGEFSDGFILGVSKIETLLQTILPPDVQKDYSVTVAENGVVIFQNSQPNSGESFAVFGAIELPDEHWRLGIVPNSVTLAGFASSIPEAALATGLFLTLLLGSTVYLLQNSRRRVKALTRAEKEIARREKLYRTLVRSLPKTAVVIFDHDHRYTLAEGAQLAADGFSKTYFEGKRLADIFAPEIVEEWKIKYDHALAGGSEIIESFRDGKNYSMHILPVRNDEGEVFSGMVLWQDVTEHKNLESDLRRTSIMQEAILDSANYSIISTTPAGIIASFNKAAEQWLGYRAEELIGMATPSVFHDPNEVARRAAELSIAPGFDVFVAGTHAGGIEEREWTYVRKDGSRFPVLLSVTAMLDDNGEITGYLGVGSDITAQKIAARTLRESEQQVRNLLEYSPVGIVLTDRSGGIKFVNDRWSKITGLTLEQAIGEGWTAAIHPDDRARIMTEWTEKSQLEEETTYEFRFVTPNGKETHVIARAIKQYDDSGEFAGHLSTISDINEIIRLQTDLKDARDAALESARLKSEFLANMSHEIRTPMNGVMGMTELLLDTPLNGFQRDAAETIRKSADSLLNIINDILDFSKIEAGKLNFETIDFDLRNTVESTVELFAEPAAYKQIELASLVNSDVPTELLGDPGRLRQILTNLIGNAVKFTQSGEIFVRVEKLRETFDHVRLSFSVSDTGIGIGEDAQKYLFQAFTQADGSMTRKFGGTGLGLAISKQLVEMMNGEISLDSEPDKGSTFTFTAEFKKQSAGKCQVFAARSDLKGLRVLIVDDNETNRSVLLHQTSAWGMNAVAAENGAQALRLLEQSLTGDNPFDVAILDLMMPEMDGFELARRIKADLAYSDIRLILMPSFGRRGHGKTARQSGISGYLIKPVKQIELFNCIAAVTGGSDLPEIAESSSLVTRYTLKEKISVNFPRILVAEDNTVNQSVVKLHLERLGYRADIVENGDLAIQALKRKNYGLLLLDCQMPEMDGYQAAQEIRRLGFRIPIIAVTANAMQGIREKCLAAGMNEYLSKPFKQQDLRRLIERFIPNSEKTESSDSTANVTPLTPLTKVFPDQSLVGDVQKRINDLETEIGTEMIGMIIDLFKEDSVLRMARLKTAVEQRNFSQISREAHGLKGSCGNVGAAVISDLCERIEDECASGVINETEELLHKIELVLPELIDILNQRQMQPA